MHDRPLTSDNRGAAEIRLRETLRLLRPDLPPDSISVVIDEEGLLSARVHDVELSSHRDVRRLMHDTQQLFERWHAAYDADDIATLLATLKVIAYKAGVAIEPGSLQLLELPGEVLVITSRGRPVAASEDPLHLLAQAIVELKAIHAESR